MPKMCQLAQNAKESQNETYLNANEYYELYVNTNGY